jgi:hypothetical protein
MYHEIGEQPFQVHSAPCETLSAAASPTSYLPDAVQKEDMAGMLHRAYPQLSSSPVLVYLG